MAKTPRPNIKVPTGPCDPKPPKRPRPPSPSGPWDKLGPNPMKWLKLGKKK
jgi:hypothetical protein